MVATCALDSETEERVTSTAKSDEPDENGGRPSHDLCEGSCASDLGAVLPAEQESQKENGPAGDQGEGNSASHASTLLPAKHESQGESSQAESCIQTKKKTRKIPAESFTKVCDILYGKRVRVRHQLEEHSSAETLEEMVEGVLRKAQGRNSVKILTDTGDIVLIRYQSVLSLEAPDGTCIVLSHQAQSDVGTKESVAGGYPSNRPHEKKAAEPREKHLLGGLKYEIEKTGPSGGRKATNGSNVEVFYEGRLAKTGQRFDKGTLDFELGTRAVIKGFEMGLEGMVQGERRKITIPWKLAYGAGGNPPTIPPRADLLFTVTLNAVS